METLPEGQGGLSGHSVRCEEHPHGVQHPYVPEPKGPWRYDELTEESILGMHFAHAVAVVSTGCVNEVLKRNTKRPSKKVFFTEPKYNPYLNNIHIDHEYDAHFKEESTFWKKRGCKFPSAKRDCQVPRPMIFVKEGPDPDHGTKVFGRSREVLPLARRKKLLTETMSHDSSNVKAQQMRTESLGPTTYKIPDPWAEKLKPVCGSMQTSSVFKSEAVRFAPPRPVFDSAPPSRPRPPSPPQVLSLTHSSASQLLSGGLLNPSLEGLDSWDSVVFDQVGDAGSVHHARPRTSPDLVINQLHAGSLEIVDSFHRPSRLRSASPSERGRSADIAQSHLPGHSFGGRHVGREGSVSSSLDSGSQIMFFPRELSVDIAHLTPPRTAPAALSSTTPLHSPSRAATTQHPKSAQSLRSPAPFAFADSQTGSAGSGRDHNKGTRKASLGSLTGPSGSLSAITPNTGSSSYHRILMSRVSPPLCYSKKPLFKAILREQREAREQKLQVQQEQREIIRSIVSGASSLPHLQKPSTGGALPRPQHSDHAAMAQAAQHAARPRTTGGV